VLTIGRQAPHASRVRSSAAGLLIEPRRSARGVRRHTTAQRCSVDAAATDPPR
jgi:hypothetical protein